MQRRRTVELGTVELKLRRFLRIEAMAKFPKQPRFAHARIAGDQSDHRALAVRPRPQQLQSSKLRPASDHWGIASRHRTFIKGVSKRSTGDSNHADRLLEALYSLRPEAFHVEVTGDKAEG